MNAAFILITAACLGGGGDPKPGPGPTPPPPGPGPAPVVVNGGGCCSSNTWNGGCCDTGCREGFLQKLHNRCGGLFQRHGHDSCNTCAPAPVHHTSCCTPKPACTSSCDCGGGGHGFFGGGRLRGLFHRKNNDCCDPCANGAYSGVIVAPPKGEPIPPPKDSKPLPPGGKKPGTVSSEPPMGNVGIPETINNQNLDIVPPAVVPNIPAIPGKSPF